MDGPSREAAATVINPGGCRDIGITVAAGSRAQQEEGGCRDTWGTAGQRPFPGCSTQST
ncbi:hypothetical protein GCM10010259_12860 [Streptomyces daghestanicus]|uniref:Uncharacterized protein n=2 Tax=Streptomyces TaxID=1883 RepID=A0A918LFD0_STRGD|nr:hypothetical protein GCM10010238_31680 [Streptomyces niveoruber]GGS99841.1 hypothetical protein GCM10010240_36540 [Streptomyces griseoviridis]GGU23964.1 hypothetical protein GCM10010259_12860 [Streptomyces daghestanicus]GHI29893.1 hypothetical protein Sdagh_16230 [Streptomyces daghestanicus]